MDSDNSPKPATNAQPGSRSLPFEIDLNETPLCSPRETLAAADFAPETTKNGVFSGEVRRIVCGSCGKPAAEVEGDMLVCSECERGFHMRCLGTKEHQKPREWKCFKCLLSNGSERLRGGVGLLDINASPPREAEGEGFFGDSQNSEHGVLARVAEQNVDKVHTVHDTSFIDHSFNAPVTNSNLLFVGNGFNLQKASRSVTHISKSGFEDIVHHRMNFNRTSKETDVTSMFEGKLWASRYTPQTFVPQNPSEVYLQALREYICERRGVLGDGWHVEFIYCQNRCKTFAVYCAPDGSRFESMPDVAHHLGLLSNCHSLETEERSDEFALVQKGLHLNRRRKESSRFSRTNNHRDIQNSRRSSFSVNFSSGIEIMDNQAGKLKTSGSIMEADSVEQFQDGLPVQFEDFFVLSVGKVDPRPSYHKANQIWPVGYKSSWHDKITGSLFVCYVSDGGDSGPTFKVRRCPCSTLPIPDGSTVLSRQKYGPCEGKDKMEKDDLATVGDDENMDIQMILAEYSPPHLNYDMSSCIGKNANEDCEFHKANSLTTAPSSLPRRYGNVIPDNLRLGDIIGEFLVEGRSSSSVWEMVSQTLLRACHEVYKQTGVLQFCCKHVVDGVNVKAMDILDSLSKFCYLSSPIDIPHLIQSDDEFYTSCKMLEKWLQQDRFGLDVEFVQEIIEQLPGVHACSEYNFLNKRGHISSLQTVGSGFLLAKRKIDEQSGEEAGGLFNSCKRPRKQVVECSEMEDSCPVGKPLSSNSKLPEFLVGDILQAWEFLCRFSEVLGLEGPFPFQELECELIDPWLDGRNLLEKDGNKIPAGGGVTLCKSKGVDDHALYPSSSTASTVPSENPCAFISMETVSMREDAQARLVSHTCIRYTGAALTKAHSSLLNVLVGELLSKVAAYVDPNFDAGESKSRRGRKKDAENSITARKTKPDMLPINELTWPELARRYILAVLSMEGNLDSAEITCRESGEVFHCLQGDGGTLCGSLTGVAGMEADALLLAEAIKKIFGSVKSKSDVVSIDRKKSDAVGASEMIKVDDSEIPEWVQALEPVRKLPTNVGARIRRCVYDALEKNPPEWAKKKLEHSISKEVYKGNASGPTKRAVISLLADVSCEIPRHKPDKKEKGKSVNTTDLIMKKCRIVLRRAAAADEEKVFCNLLGRTVLNPNDNDDEGLLGYPAMVSRPLDFRTIDLRLAAGAYCGSHEAFLEDVREVWHNIHTAYGDRSDFIDLAETLSQNFEALYEKEVLALAQKLLESANSNCLSDEAKKEMEDMLVCASERSLPKAPWDDGVCKVCGVDKDDDNVLLCDTCDSEYHTYCLNPPLARIPEGNWYCPSCVSGRFMSQGVSCGTQAISRCQKKRDQGEFAHNFLEALARLANTMELKEYWEFSVEERILLIKFVCDEALNLAIIRDHLDRCASTSADLQQKLRPLSSEWKNLKIREEILATNLAKVNGNVHDGVGELGSDGFASANDDNLKGQLPNGSNYISSFSGNFVQLEHGLQRNGRNDHSKQPCRSFSKSSSEKPCTSSRNQIFRVSDTVGQLQYQQPVKDQSLVSENLFCHTCPNELPESISQQQKNDLSGEKSWSNFSTRQELRRGSSKDSMLTTSQDLQGHISYDTISTHVAELTPFMHVNSEHLLHGHHSSVQDDANVSHAYNLEMNSLKNEISVLQDSIARLESELQKISVRKEYLGRDSAGRLYWVFWRPGTCPRFVVNGSMTKRQSKVKEHGNQNNATSRNLFSYGIENPFCSRGLDVSNLYEYEQNDSVPICTWVSYQSDAEIESLIGWLRDSDARERELKESILNWQRNKSKESDNAENHVQNEKQTSLLKPSDTGKTVESSFLVTKAVTALEKKYGPCLELEATDIPKKRGRKAKVIYEGRLHRCECLEPIWPSRHHCLSCHRTFSTSEELEGHNDGMCSRGSPVPQNSKVAKDSLKRKQMMRTETSLEKHSDDMGIVRASKSDEHELGSNLIQFQKESECPFDFEEISAKFVTPSSLKEMVRNIGLIGSNGIPSFVPSISPYLGDPALTLGPSRQNGVNTGERSTNLENHLQQSIEGTNIIAGMSCDNISSNLPRCAENGIDVKASNNEILKSNCMNKRDQFSSIKNKSPGLGVGKCCIIRESSLRPLVGRVAQILQRLKINLLDMDAALPEEALRPSMAHLERRFAWRAFVKSAQSIYEMVQATIILENMIKSVYLKNDWWYWSSLSAAAKISTLTALALRIYTLDAAIFYGKPLHSLDSTEILKPGCKSEKELPPNSHPTNNVKPGSPPIQKSLNSDLTENSKLKSRASKRRKDSGG
uniref:Putative methyl-CpG-binding domain-containing protein 9 n=1 Tax=Davidia involucrata TaxID=16924 RepID=A0A5B6ZUU5_DAVIN